MESRAGSSMRVAITGGCGYIGSNVAKLLLARGDDVLLVDDMSNAKPGRPEAIAKAAGGREAAFIQLDARRQEELARALGAFAPDWIVHCAGLKSVRESKVDPLRYWRVNVGSTESLARSAPAGSKILFSSSATVYASSERPVAEDGRLGPSSAYGRSKLACEWMLRDAVQAGALRSAAALRYFNPLGSDSTGLLGDDPLGAAENVMPALARATQADPFRVFGQGYPTRDGTAVRDYVHVEDLARAHLAVMDSGLAPWEEFNVGSGGGSSVRELVEAFQAASGRALPWVDAPARPGDAACSVADCSKIERVGGWRARMDLRRMCASALAARGLSNMEGER